MSRQNRVTPLAEIVAAPGRGLLTGNRGCLVDGRGQMTGRRWTSTAWIACTLAYKGVRRPLMQPRTWTELFFLDEAVALAAGHRPCALCRRGDYRRFQEAWASASGATCGAKDIDRALHRARLTPERHQCRHGAVICALPDGSFILQGGTPMLIRGAWLFPYRPDGYGPPVRRPGDGTAEVLTPAPTVAALGAGYRPLFHPSAS